MDQRQHKIPGVRESDDNISVGRLYGNNTSVHIQAADGPELNIEKGCVITPIDIFPGVTLTFQDIHMEYLDYEGEVFDFPEDLISIQHCREGRFEGEYRNGECFYLGQGDLSVNLPFYSPSKNAFPLSHYHGISIIILPEAAQKALDELEQVLGSLEIDFAEIAKNLTSENKLAIYRRNPSVEHILSEVYQVQIKMQESYLKLKVVELLIYLSSAKAIPSKKKVYFNREQVRAVKEISKYLTEHPDRHDTLQELSARFDIPLTSMKTCFKGVYGMSIGAYLREYRMQTGAEMLRNTGLQVGEIALSVGYESPSKFAEAFQKRFGCTPTEYRKNS